MVCYGGGCMATSSIFTNIIIKEPGEAERFVDILEESNQENELKSSVTVKRTLTDLDEIRKLMEKKE
jgi:hypothetical protein